MVWFFRKEGKFKEIKNFLHSYNQLESLDGNSQILLYLKYSAML